MGNLLLLAGVLLIAYLVQSITGYGGALLSMPFAILLIGLEDARILIGLASCLTGVIISLKDYKFINRRQLARILLVMTIGMAVGLWLDQVLGRQLLLSVYGITVVGLAVRGFVVSYRQSKSTSNMVCKILILFFAGVMQSLFLSGGAFLMVYALDTFDEKREFRATSSAVWAILNFFLLMTYLAGGYFNANNSYLSLTFLPLIFIVNYLGTKLLNKINQSVFVGMVNGLLLFSGLMLLLN